MRIRHIDRDYFCGAYNKNHFFGVIGLKLDTIVKKGVWFFSKYTYNPYLFSNLKPLGL